MRFRFFACLLSISLCGLLACSSTNSTVTTAGTGVLYIAAQGDSSLTAYTAALSNGAADHPGFGAEPRELLPLPSPCRRPETQSFVDNNASDSVSATPLIPMAP